MEIDEEYIDKVKSLIEQKDAENVKTLLTDLHPADKILEAMKMENEIVAPQDGTVASINVNKGDTVNSGDTLVSMN